MALNVVAVLKVKPGFEDAFGAAGKTLVEASRKDPGCLRYDLFTGEGCTRHVRHAGVLGVAGAA